MRQNHHSGQNWYLSRMKKMPALSTADVISFITGLSNNPVPMSHDRAQAILDDAVTRSAIVKHDGEKWSGNPEWLP